MDIIIFILKYSSSIDCVYIKIKIDGLISFLGNKKKNE